MVVLPYRSVLSRTRGILLAAALVPISWPLAAAAQQAPPPDRQQAPAPAPGVAPHDEPSSPTPRAVKPSETPAGQIQGQNLVGLLVFSSDGTRVGEVRSVDTGPAGDIVALHVRTGGFLGFGGRIVAIPGGKFIRSGHSIRLALDSDEVAGLPEVKN